MTMRSAPPASSYLAEMPVPAPAPIMGWPCAFMARKRARMSERLMRGITSTSRAAPSEPRAEQAAELGGDLGGEARVVDVFRHADEAARTRLPHGRFQRAEQLRIRSRI